MADAITIQELIDARTDAKTLEEAVNGDAVTTVLSRLGETYPTLSNAINQIDSKLDSADTQIKQGITNLFENGGLPATPFKTKALMTASALVDGKYAMVTDNTVNNGLYVKTAGAWVKSGYDPLGQAMSYTDAAKSSAVSTAAGDATTKANAAKTEAIADAALDATTKANNAITTAGTNADTKIAAAFAKSSGTFDTLALLTASSLVDNAYALVANDADLTKNGHYKKLAGVWTKVKYDPLAEAKKYSDTKVLHIVGKGQNNTIVVDYGAKVGDLFINDINNLVYVITSINPTTNIANSTKAVITANTLYIYSDTIYIRDESGVLGAVVDFQATTKNQVVRIKGKGVLNEPEAENLQIGDYFWLVSGGGSIQEIVGFKTGGYLLKTLPYSKSAVYIYDGVPYFYNGKELQSFIKNTGKRTLIEQPIEEKLLSYANGLVFSNELRTPLTELTKAGDKFAHTPAFAIHNNIGYSIFMVNYTTDTENPPELSIRFHSFPMSDPTNITYYDICNIGDIILGREVVKNFDSVIFLQGDVLHLMWIVTFAGDDFYTMLRQTFNTVTGVFGDIELASFKVGTTTNTFSAEGINSAFTAAGMDMPQIGSAQLALQPQISKLVESGTTYYYAGIGFYETMSLVLRTTDFITWEYVTHPDFKHFGIYEPAVYAYAGWVYLYNRQDRHKSEEGFLTRYHIKNKYWEDPVYIPECQSRSEFFMRGTKLYLIYAPIDRKHMSIMLINQSYLEHSKVVQEASYSQQYAYPVTYEYNNELYMLFSSNKLNIYVSKYTIGSVSSGTVKVAMAGLFNIPI